MASAGYPESYANGSPIRGLELAEKAPATKVFHAGTAMAEDRFITNGGRVLGVTAWAADLREARDAAYAAVAQIHFEGAQYRRDITGKVISK
jgi:phosphoribosylamine--glycine ligase